MKVKMFDTKRDYNKWFNTMTEKFEGYDFLVNCLCAVYRIKKNSDGTTWGGFDCNMAVYEVKKLSTAVKRFAKALRTAGLISYAEYVENYWGEGSINEYSDTGFAFKIEENDDNFYFRLAMVQTEMVIEPDTSDFIIENGVLKNYIGKDATVTIPDGITEISNNAFYNCTTLKTLIMPNSVTKVGSYAFSYCTALNEITLSTNITKISYQAFRSCSSLKKITIPDSVTKIGGSAFYNCRKLKTIVIPDSVDTIRNCVFEGCTSLQSITIPDSVTRIGYGVFDGCTSLQSVTFPKGVTSIEGGTFEGCTSLQSITIPDSVTNIGDGAFCNCNLKSIKGCYKAFQLNGYGQLQCRDYIFNENQEPQHIENIKVCFAGYHYCTNLFEIFDYYKGELDVDIVVYEIEPVGAIMIEENSSKCCCQSFKFKKKLYREDVIRILNGGE